MNRLHLICTLTICGLAMCPLPGAAQRISPPTERVITADFNNVRGPLNTMFRECVAAGRKGVPSKQLDIRENDVFLVSVRPL